MVTPIVLSLAKSGLDLRKALSSLKVVTVGGAYLGEESATALRTVFQRDDVLIQQGWGMTETTASVTLFHNDQTNGITVGRLVANMEAKFVGEDGSPVLPGHVGEAIVRGPNIFMGYWRNKAATVEAMSTDGWLRTGDLVVVDEDGLWTVAGRNKVSYRLQSKWSIMLRRSRCRNSSKSRASRSHQASLKAC